MMLEVLRQDYIRTAWSKGLNERVVIMRHAIKNALIPIVTLIGMQLPMLVGGAVIMEEIFALPGIGRLFLDALEGQRLPGDPRSKPVFIRVRYAYHSTYRHDLPLPGPQGALHVEEAYERRCRDTIDRNRAKETFPAGCVSLSGWSRRSHWVLSAGLSY